jgi:hypothetical protein
MSRFLICAPAALALAATCVAAVPATAATAPPVVISIDAENDLFTSDGASSSLLQHGRPDAYPLASSRDGSTSIWHVGTAFQQIDLIHNGKILKTQ